MFLKNLRKTKYKKDDKQEVKKIIKKKKKVQWTIDLRD